MFKKNYYLNFIVAIVLSLSFNTTAQKAYSEQLYMINWGFGRTAGTYHLPEGDPLKMSFAHIPMTYEYFTRNGYFYTDILTPCIDLCLGAFNRQFWWGHRRDNYIFRGGDWPLIRLGLGGHLGDNFGIYGGIQWGYSQWRVTGVTNNYVLYDDVTEEQFGGHMYGLGIHPVLNTDKLVFRSSIMFDFVTDGFKGKNYTNSLTWDFMIRYAISRNKMWGAFANYVYSNRQHVQLSKFRFGVSLAFEK